MLTIIIVIGYSVFAIVQEDTTKPLALPRSDADHIACFVTEDDRPSEAYRSGGGEPSGSTFKATRDSDAFRDDEDADLQAALRASIANNAYTEPDSSTQMAASNAVRTPRTPRTPIQGARSVSSLPPLRRPTLRDFEMIENDEDDDDESEYPPVIPPRPEPDVDLDPLAASRARSQAYMQQVMREQEAALRETRDAEAAAIEAGYRTRPRDRRQEQEEEELRRAIEASLASHPPETSDSGSGGRDAPIEIDEEDVDEELEYLGSNSASRSERREPLAEIARGGDRVYDDEDAELQAALRASLEDVPPGFTMPDTPQRAPASLPVSLPFVDASTKTNVPPPTADEDARTETESEADTTTAEEEEREQVSMEEMRMRRLARFGG